MTRDERDPISGLAELPALEVGDYGSFTREPEHGDGEAREPELERLDLVADEPGPEDVDALEDDDNPLGGVH